MTMEPNNANSGNHILEYFPGTLYEAIERTAQAYPDNTAYDFLGCSVTYSHMLHRIQHCAEALRFIGARPGDRITIALPNCPQAVLLFYAVNSIGAIANMVHPLCAEKELEFYLRSTGSAIAITLDLFCEKFTAIRNQTSLKHLIVTRIHDELPSFLKIAYTLRPSPEYPRKTGSQLLWNAFLHSGSSRHPFQPFPMLNTDPAAILYSGGTTGTPKGVTLTSLNFNALAQQILAANPIFRPGDKMLAALPIFHGFGLGICIHSMLFHGGCCVLVPRFTPKSYARDLTKHRCAFIAGVPALFASVLDQKVMHRKDLSFLKGVFSGGDALSPELKERFDTFLQAHRSPVRIREGYGAAETVSACCLMPENMQKAGSIGLPLPDMKLKIVDLKTGEECSPGETGEILISGPTVMQGYWNRPDETTKVLYRHTDGLLWLRTGDLGRKDGEGYLFFSGRVKRMIISSGYNIYPAQLESILNKHEAIQLSCVIGIPDPIKGQRVKAFIQLKSDFEPSKTLEFSILEHCRGHIAKYAIPAQLEFVTELPKTPIGKVDYRSLEA